MDKKHKILIVEDNVSLADVMAELLRRKGHNVEVVYDGQTAIETAIAFEPNILFVDITMPIVDGYMVVEKIKNIPQLADSKLIALTGHNGDEIKQKILSAGFDAHLVKPASSADLSALLETV